MNEHDLVTLGFAPRGDGTRLMPAGEFYRVSIELPSGDVLTCHISKRALKKIQREASAPATAKH